MPDNLTRRAITVDGHPGYVEWSDAASYHWVPEEDDPDMGYVAGVEQFVDMSAYRQLYVELKRAEPLRIFSAAVLLHREPLEYPEVVSVSVKGAIAQVLYGMGYQYADVVRLADQIEAAGNG